MSLRRFKLKYPILISVSNERKTFAAGSVEDKLDDYDVVCSHGGGAGCPLPYPHPAPAPPPLPPPPPPPPPPPVSPGCWRSPGSLAMLYSPCNDQLLLPFLSPSHFSPFTSLLSLLTSPPHLSSPPLFGSGQDVEQRGTSASGEMEVTKYSLVKRGAENSLRNFCGRIEVEKES